MCFPCPMQSLKLLMPAKRATLQEESTSSWEDHYCQQGWQQSRRAIRVGHPLEREPWAPAASGAAQEWSWHTPSSQADHGSN